LAPLVILGSCTGTFFVYDQCRADYYNPPTHRYIQEYRVDVFGEGRFGGRRGRYNNNNYSNYDHCH
jgi:hypothetical protein